MAKPKSGRALHPLEQVDLEIADTVQVGKRTKAGRRLARFAELGDQPPLRILCALVVGAGLLAQDRKLVRTGLRMIAAHSLATLAKGFVKDEVDRTRPGVAIDDNHYTMEKGRSRDSRLQSMPSGHSAGLAAVARAAAREYPTVALPAASAAGAVAFAQLPSGNHFATDVVAGVTIGLLAEKLVDAAMGPVDERS